METDELVPESGNLTKFIEQFPIFASAPGGVEKLRDMVLKLAVAGKLHVQTTNSSSTELLENIRLQNQQLVKEKKIRKSKTLPNVNEGLFDIPKNWIWTRLGEWGDWGSGATPSRSISSYYGGSIPWFKSGELTGDVITESKETITEEAVKNSAVKQCLPGDVLLAMYGATIGKTAILGVQGTTNQAVCACTCFSGIDNKFLLLLLKAYNSYFSDQGVGGAQPNISRDKIVNTLVPLPPHDEQKLIVAKVDELMAICDKLEAQQQQQANNILRANTAAITALLNSDNLTTTSKPQTETFEQNWQRIAQNFNTLYGCTLPMPPGEGRQKKYLVGLENVQKLRQAILQLAVMGKLVTAKYSVSSNPSVIDTLLNEVKENKMKIIAKDRKPKELFNAPSHWPWLQFEDLLEGSDSGWSPKCYGHPRESGNWGVLKVSAVTWSKFKQEENKELPENLEARTEYEVKNNDFLLSRANTAELVARSVVVNGCGPKLIMSDKIVRLHFHKKLNKEYLNIWNNSVFVRDYYISHASGTSDSMRNVTRQIMHEVPIPLPFLEEQEKIIQQVNKLMKYCDQLEYQLSKSYKVSEKLMDATVKSLVA
jgi:type I restriction enzyme, S subunit